jgi:hypothetical protein
MPPFKYSHLQNIIPARVKYETNFIFTVYKFYIALSRLRLKKIVKIGQKSPRLTEKGNAYSRNGGKRHDCAKPPG